MALEISNDNDYFKISGSLNRENLHVFEDTFHNIFAKLDRVVISIENLEGIDRAGVNAIAKLHNESLFRHKKLAIIGNGCKDLYNHFHSNDAA